QGCSYDSSKNEPADPSPRAAASDSKNFGVKLAYLLQDGPTLALPVFPNSSQPLFHIFYIRIRVVDTKYVGWRRIVESFSILAVLYPLPRVAVVCLFDLIEPEPVLSY